MVNAIAKKNSVGVMLDTTDAILTRIAEEISGILNENTTKISRSMDSDLILLENLLSKLPAAIERNSRAIMKEADERIEYLTGSIRNVDNEKFLRSAEETRLNRLEKIEHEMMAKLVNTMRGRDELLSLSNCLKESISGIASESDAISHELDLRRSALKRLKEAIPAIQSALEKDIAECFS